MGALYFAVLTITQKTGIPMKSRRMIDMKGL
jgi:hypothetical protein